MFLCLLLLLLLFFFFFFFFLAGELDVQDYVRKCFEARVAVMGFKCRQMQLQGEVEHLSQTAKQRDQVCNMRVFEAMRACSSPMLSFHTRR